MKLDKKELIHLILTSKLTTSISNSKILGIDTMGSAGNNLVAINASDIGASGELALKEDKINKGVIGGYAELDTTGRVPVAQLPAYVDEVIEVANAAALPATGVASKIYTTLDDNKIFRWGGTAYVEISASLALGELSTTAYRGDRGKTGYDHSQVATGNPHSLELDDLDDLDAGSPSNNEVLTYNSSTSKWEAKVVSISGAVAIDDLTDGKGATGSYSVFLGTNSGGTSANNGFNVGVGVYSLEDLTTGTNNTVVGFQAAKDLIGGSDNVAIGRAALKLGTTTTTTIAIGVNSLSKVTSDNSNTAVGYISGGDQTNGSYNTHYGRGSGDTFQNGTGNTYIGASTVASGTSVNNETVLGYGTIGNGANTSTVGNASDTNFYTGTNGQSVINTKATKHTLLSGALTNPPTAAELIALAGVCATVGSGYSTQAYDSANSIMYDINTDGTDWFYTAKTKAV